MLPDRVSNPRTPDLRVRCPTDCATQPGHFAKPSTQKCVGGGGEGIVDLKHKLLLCDPLSLKSI